MKRVILQYDSDAKIILFGSRVYDDKKGGDIDIFVQTKKSITLSQKLQILAKIEIEGLSRRVDLIVKTPQTKNWSIFKTILEEIETILDNITRYVSKKR